MKRNQTLFSLDALESGAIFSPCRTWRYKLWRVWDDGRPPLNVIGLNPSTADETANDPTIRRCIGFARDWGYGGLLMTNIFAFRATDPRVMKAHPEPIGQDNDLHLKKAAAVAGLVLAAWGNHGAFLERGEAVRKMIPGLQCFRVTKSGHPEHPLYQRADARLIEFECSAISQSSMGKCNA